MSTNVMDKMILYMLVCIYFKAKSVNKFKNKLDNWNKNKKIIDNGVSRKLVFDFVHLFGVKIYKNRCEYVLMTARS